MDRAGFWTIIDDARSGAEDDSAFLDRLRARLRTLPTEELPQFQAAPSTVFSSSGNAPTRLPSVEDCHRRADRAVSLSSMNCGQRLAHGRRLCVQQTIFEQQSLLAVA
jgi:hypothetical protein